MIWIRTGSAILFLAVALGAFGAHALKSRLSPDMAAIFETAIRYQFYHGFGLLFVGWLSQSHSHQYVTFAGWSFVAGIAVFSGSLIILSLTGVRSWGAVTPLGGLAFLAGWLALFLFSFKKTF
jgi:uncharacterized membrane protein YgdD (TMEM256/DUF423 family)